MSTTQTGLSWPNELERTPEDEREKTTKFSVNFSTTQKELRKEMGRMDVDQWRIDHVSGSGGDPGVVLRWDQDGTPHAVACDRFTTKGDNLRSVYLWVNETRMRANRPVVTGDTDFAAARLMPPDEAPEPTEPPHEVLGVQADAPDEVVDAARRARLKTAHPDQGGSAEEKERVERAAEAMMGE